MECSTSAPAPGTCPLRWPAPPTREVTAVDISPEALAVAQRNATTHGVADRVTFLRGDLFAPLPKGASFDFILSNPPYIPH